jgi:hypothetical protein
MTPSEIVSDYIRRYRRHARAELDEYQKLPSLRQAIRHASLCHRLPSLKRHPHQYRIQQHVLLAAERELHRSQYRLARAGSFKTLHTEIERRIGGLHGIGPLTVYDIAHRIGSFLRLKPEHVYLHSGTGIGARLLGFTGKTLDPRSLPSAFSRLTPDEIEDCLCIYMDAFRSRGFDARTSKPRRVCIGPPRSMRRC